MIDEAYNNVLERASRKSITASDFDTLIEAVAKSTREKIHRRTRISTDPKKSDPKNKSIVKKKPGKNDPPRQGRGTKYASGTPAKERQNVEQKKRVAKEDTRKEETRTYEVTGYSDQLDNFEKLLNWIESCGTIGHSGSASIFIDGDGSARLKISGTNKDNIGDVSDSDSIELKVGID